MATLSPSFQELWRLFHSPPGIDSVLDGYLRIDDAASSGEIDADQDGQLRASAFRAMRSTTEGEPERVAHLILDLLLPECLNERGGEGNSRTSRTTFRELLRDWLGGLPEKIGSELRAEILSKLCRDLEVSADPSPACWTIAAIGFRGNQVSASLWRVLDRLQDEMGDAALVVLSSLGISGSERVRLVSIVVDRARDRCTTRLIQAMNQLADPAFLDVLSRWRAASESPFENPMLDFLLLGIPARVAEAADFSPEIQDRAWNLIMELYRSDPERFAPKLYLGGNVAPLCDSPKVIPDLIKELFTGPDNAATNQIRRIQLFSRLGDCYRPRQLTGWESAGSEAYLSFVTDAIRDTKAGAPFQTTEMMLKEEAWHALLSIRDDSMPTAARFESAVAGETSFFVRHTISDILSCFRIDPPPESVVRWVTERTDIKKERTDEIVFRLAACRLLTSSASRGAFDALTHIGFTFEGGVLHQSADALISVARVLARGGDLSIGPELQQIVVNGDERAQRTVAAETLACLAEAELLSQTHYSSLETAALDNGRDDYERSRIVEAIGFLPSVMTTRLEQAMAEWACGEGQTAARSLEALARLGLLIHQRERLEDRLGLVEKEDGSWRMESATDVVPNVGPVLGLLYRLHPEAFLDAVCFLLKESDWMTASRLIPLIEPEDDGGCVDPTIIEAMVARIERRQTSYEAELDLFDVLGRWSSRVIASHPWDESWGNWLPDSRCALADALGEIAMTEGLSLDHAVHMLTSLAGDGLYAVRRSAYRALGRLAPRALIGFCEMAAPSPDRSEEEQPAVELRRRGAEATAWLTQEAFDLLHEKYLTDRELSVREPARSARAERRQRLNAESLLEKVLGASGGATDEILDAWRYGRALTEVGDDTTIRALRQYRSSTVLPPNVHHWYGEIEKEVHGTWQKKMQKWPDPWLSWEGAMEEGRGVLRFDKAEVAVKYAIWRRRQDTAREAYSWGGAAWTEDRRPSLLMAETGILILAGDRRGNIHMSQSTGNFVSFMGRGPFPA
jgi:hypothetical protein